MVPGDAIALISETINQVRRGQIDPRVANSVGFLTEKCNTGELDEAEKDRRQGRAPSRRAVPASGFYRHESEPAQSGGDPVL
jgi:hypothetical protein